MTVVFVPSFTWQVRAAGRELQFFARRPLQPSAAAWPLLLEIALDAPAVTVERRRDVELRVVFDEVYPRLESMYDTSRTWGGSVLTTLAYRVVRESYPQLDALRVQTLVTAMLRVHRERRARGARMQHAAVPAREPA